MSEGFDWIELAVKVAGWAGMNPVRVRWRLRAWQNRVKARRDRVLMESRSLTRGVKTCPSCGAIQGSGSRCTQCGAPLYPFPIEFFRRVLRRAGVGVFGETFIAAACLAVFLITSVLSSRLAGASAIISPDPRLLVELGGNLARLTVAGEWWRLWTAVFLHAGPVHLAFNLIALFYVAPRARDHVGGDRMLIAYALSGLAASGASAWWSLAGDGGGVSIGASGAIAGLIGLLLVRGWTDKSRAGLELRNQMLRWMAYVLVFGFFINADNAAHLGGFAAGTLLGSVLPRHLRSPFPGLEKAAGTAVLIAAAAAAGWIGWLAYNLP